MVWYVMLFRGTGLLTTNYGNLNGTEYIDILGNYMLPSAHPFGYGNR